MAGCRAHQTHQTQAVIWRHRDRDRDRDRDCQLGQEQLRDREGQRGGVCGGLQGEYKGADSSRNGTNYKQKYK